MCDTTTNDLGLTDAHSVCTCSAGDHTERSAYTGDNVIREHYLLAGLTCSHCVARVTEQLTKVDGVESVSVALNAGGNSKVMIVSSTPIPVEAVHAAISDAGYELVTTEG